MEPEKRELETIVTDVMRGLKDFQRATVDRVCELFQVGQNRVLVADEVGLGKTLVARGVVAKTAAWCQEKGKRHVKVAYICSNGAVAEQNLRRLQFGGNTVLDSIGTARLSMQHLNIFQQESDTDFQNQFIQLIPLTPDTSFRMTSGRGIVSERALMFSILRRIPELRNWQSELSDLMAHGANVSWNWCREVYEDKAKKCNRQSGGTYFPYMKDTILKELHKPNSDGANLLDMVRRLCHEIRRRGCIPEKSASNVPDKNLVLGELRTAFAVVSLDKLEPDLVILDEFQRFRFLLREDETSEAGMLIRRFFQSDTERVLLLSATPYKMYSTLDELEVEGEDTHFAEFFDVVDFLRGRNSDRCKEFHTIWQDFSFRLRDAARNMAVVLPAKETAEQALYQNVCRTERTAEGTDLLDTSGVQTLTVTDADVLSYRDAQMLLRRVGLAYRVNVDYIKSSPYLLSFMRVDDYKIKRILGEYYSASEHQKELKKADSPFLWLDRTVLSSYKPIQCNNARLERVQEIVFSGNPERLLWVPPSKPYYPPEGPFRENPDFTKTLVFSAWAMVPRMLSSLLSYESERRTVAVVAKDAKMKDGERDISYFTSEIQDTPIREDDRSIEKTKTGASNIPDRGKKNYRYPPMRLRFRLREGQPVTMALFCLLYPSRFLAHCFQPVSCLNNSLSLKEIERKLMDRIANGLAGFPSPKTGREDNRWYCLAPLLLDTEELDGDKEKKSFVSDWLDQEEDMALGNDVTQKAFARHLQELRRLYEQAVTKQGTFPLGRRPDDLLSVLSDMALASPAVCFSRTFQEYTADGEHADGSLCCKTAQAFLNRMNTTEATAVVELVCGRSEDAHWKNLLTYCKQGNFQAVLDEYAFLLSNNLDSSSHHVERLATAMQEGLSLQSASYTADTYPAFCKRMKRGSANTAAKKNGISMRTHFAVAFTEGDGQEKNINRKTAVRNAFNSPFQPFVLATTSIGQEGLDFHNYCRRIVHWNLPSNPIDLEQREGRIQRFACLAIRQNLVRRYGTQTFQDENVWQELFRRAEQVEKENGSSDLIPYWGLREKADDLVSIERIVPMYPFSKDGLVYERMMKILSLYRLTLGQSRQEELLEYLFSHAESPEQFRKLFMNLSPFYRQREKQEAD